MQKKTASGSLWQAMEVAKANHGPVRVAAGRKCTGYEKQMQMARAERNAIKDVEEYEMEKSSVRRMFG